MSTTAQYMLLTITVILASLAGGYVARKRSLLSQRVAEALMTFVAVFGYTAVSFLTIWVLEAPRLSDALLPVMGGMHWMMMAGLSILTARTLKMDFENRGVLGVTGGAGNTGFTMGGFIIYLLAGEQGLALVSIYCLCWTPMIVLFLYPVARHYAHGPLRVSLGRLMLQSLLDWRSIGLPISIVSLFLCVYKVPRPAIISEYRVVDVLMFVVTAMAYFSIGMRVHLGDLGRLAKMIFSLAALRFAGGLAIALGMLALLALTPWPLEGLRRDVFLIESFVPTAVIGVAVCSMFHLRPRSASVLFLVNTVMYLVLVLPIVMWVFGRVYGQ